MARLNLEFDAEREAEEGKRRRERERVEQKARMKQAGITAATTTVVATSKTTKTRAKRDKAKGVALNVEDLAESPLRLPARTQTLSPPRQPAPVRRRRLVKKALLMESSSSSSESESGEVQDEEKDSEDDGRRTGKGRWRLTRANSSGSDSQGSRPPSPPSHAQRKDPPRQRFIPRNLLAKRRELEV
ncbi:hypothetical protein BDZ91DRAFT_743386 [Kalaharituber pfeilii]|nr:hypothetical protein BDZ91DRAFT_743386 [Kalaharituber pfeilii]